LIKLLSLLKSLLPDRLTPAAVALLYAAFAALWIVVSGHLLTITVADPVLMGRIELAKGMAFVAVTSGLLYLLLRVRGASNIQDGRGKLIGTWQMLLIFAVLALIVPLIGFSITRLYGPQVECATYANLETIARLKAGQIENWLDERQEDSKGLASDDAFMAQVARFVQREHDAKLSRIILDRFEKLNTSYHYTKILLLNSSGRVLLTEGEDVTTEPVLPSLWHQALASKQVQRRDMYLDKVGDIHLEWAVPMVVTDAQGKHAVAVMVLRVTAQRYISPLIQTWPTVSASGETLLVRREGGYIMFLNDLRYRQDSALKLTVPLTDAERPDVGAILSAKPGTMQGKDYRGVEVLAAYRPVAGTNWHIVAKIDRAEALAPLRDLVLWVSLIAISAVSVVVMLLWRQQQRAYQVEIQSRSMEAIEESERRYRAVTQTANDSIIIADSAGNVVEWNTSAAKMFGYTEAEILGQPLTRLMTERYREVSLKALARVASRIIGKTVEVAGLRKDGSEFPLEISLAQWQTSSGRFFSATIRDITLRKAAETKIQRLTHFYAALSQCNEAIVRSTSEDELFPQICRSAVEFGGMKMAWIGLVDEARKLVNPVASYGEGTEYLDGIRISLEADDPYASGPTGQSIRDNQPQWFQDFQHDMVDTPWREQVTRFGWSSAASLPLLRNGVVVGAFTLYSEVLNAFDENARMLLTEMAVDISFALDSFARDAKHKQAELELAASEQHFRSLFENMLEGYTYCKMLFRNGVAEEFVFLKVNQAFETLTGLKDVAGKLASEAIPGFRESNPEMFEIYGRVALNGQPEQFEMYVAVLRRWFAISVYCPEPEHFVAIFDNVTARKHSEQVLAESEQRFRGVVEQTLTGIYIIQDGRFVYVNPRFAEIFGYASASELIGVEPALLVAEQDHSIAAENIRSRIDNGVQSLSYGFTGVRKDGSQIEVGVHGARATHDGRPAIIGLMQDVSEKKRDEERIQRYVKQLEHAFMNTIEVATTLLEMRDPYTAGHEKRVAQIAVAIATELGMDAHRIEGLRVGGYIHDIGKIIVPAEILTKPGRLTAAEYELVKGHPQAGYDILKNVDFPWPVADIAYQHHERMDGSGYPRGLKGEEILLEARITAVADVVETMASHRPYRPGLGLEHALAEIEGGSGTLYDPVIVDICLRLFREQGYELPAL
jgi:PAS domain S-box-containing protein/putative nucleotidyltransferase with HDIG domain